jgi:hypothetical protein
MFDSAWVGARERGQWFALGGAVHERARSVRACTIFNFAVWGFTLGFLFSLFCQKNK